MFDHRRGALPNRAEAIAPHTSMERKKVMRQSSIAGIIALAGLAFAATAQDSVSTFGAPTPGDAIDPFSFSVQTGYTVEMTPLMSSGGTMFGIAPVMKASRANLTFSNNLISSQAISQDTISGDNLSSESFFDWSPSDALGSGINTAGGANVAAGTVTGPASSSQIAMGFAEFGTSDFGVDINVLSTARINYNTTGNTLFVRRTTAAINSLTAMDGDFSNIGFGTIDADGNALLRSDAFGVGGGSLPNVIDDNIVRVQTSLVGSLNTLSGNGAADAGSSTFIIEANDETHSVPSIIPASVVGDTDGSYFTARFDGNLSYGDVGSISFDASHRPGSSDHRGTVAWQPAVHFTGTVGTGSVYGRSFAGGGATDSMVTWGTLADGTPTGSCTLTLPSAIDGIAPGLFTNYRSQISFNGGSGLIATGTDNLGNNLTAATSYIGADENFTDDPQSAIVVARTATDSCDADWSVAAFVTAAGGSPIFGPGGAQIGQLTPLFNLTGGAPLGPSMSPPAFDAYGNIYFSALGEFTDSPDILDAGLFRAVYNPSDFSYRVEVIFRQGDIFSGGDSGLDYQIGFIGIADNNSLSSGAFFSSNVNQNGWGGNGATDNAADAANLGGLLFSAEITYDVDGDGDFDTAEAGSADEEYNTVLFIGNLGVEDECVADFNGDGSVNILDVLGFINTWNVQGPGSDFNGDGSINILDVLGFINTWNLGCP
jgi:hypothetical protein